MSTGDVVVGHAPEVDGALRGLRCREGDHSAAFVDDRAVAGAPVVTDRRSRGAATATAGRDDEQGNEELAR